MDLITFLRERIDEDEHWAHMAEAGWPPENGLAASEHPEHYPFTATDITPSKAAFIRQHSPARVLREVETWRRILLEYQTAGLDTSVPPERVTGFRYALSFAIKAKAATYPDHPDYTPDAWAPAYAG